MFHWSTMKGLSQMFVFAQLLDKLIVAVGCAGLIFNAEKWVVLTNQAQPPPTLVIREDVVVKVLDRNRGPKWLGCMLTAGGSMIFRG